MNIGMGEEVWVIKYQELRIIRFIRTVDPCMDDPWVVASLVITIPRDLEWVIYLAYSRSLHGWPLSCGQSGAGPAFALSPIQPPMAAIAAATKIMLLFNWLSLLFYEKRGTVTPSVVTNLHCGNLSEMGKNEMGVLLVTFWPHFCKAFVNSVWQTH